MYLDECGHATYSPKRVYNKVNERYLTVGGLLLRGDLRWKVIEPKLRAIKAQYFLDEDVPLHFTDLLAGRGCFSAIAAETREKFYEDFLGIIASTDCQLISITIDKQRMQHKYRVYQDYPYHLSMALLIERLIYTLGKLEARLEAVKAPFVPLIGKIIIEARGSTHDQKLAESYRNIFTHGSKRFVTLQNAEVQRRLSSNELQICAKTDRNVGLEVADMVCNPLHWNTLFELAAEDVTSILGLSGKTPAVERFWEIAGPRIACSDTGRRIGYGIKLFPSEETFL